MASVVLSKTFAAAATLAVTLSLAAAPAAGADEAPNLDLARHTAIAAIAATDSGGALKALADSLALLGARYRLEASGGADHPGGSDPAPANEQPEPPTAAEIARDPSLLPPASAGSNGTHVPHKASLRAEPLFAHSRGSHESTAILLSGVALAPPSAPEAVKGAINNANTIVGRPYIWGGGHGSFYSYGYDCSGAVSFALFGGGLIPEPLTSTALESWGAPGPGRWITVYASASHTFAEIAGLRWDTVGDENGTGPRWHLATAAPDGFVVRHPPGL